MTNVVERVLSSLERYVFEEEENLVLDRSQTTFCKAQPPRGRKAPAKLNKVSAT